MSMSAFSGYGQTGSFTKPYTEIKVQIRRWNESSFSQSKAGIERVGQSESEFGARTANSDSLETLLVFKIRFIIGEQSGTTTWVQLNTVLIAVNRLGTLDNVNHNNLLEDSQFALSELPQVISRI